MTDTPVPATITSAPLTIAALLTVDDTEMPDLVRYEFTLHSGNGVERKFIIDVPNEESGTTDVWVLDQTVEVGDTPEDGFATYTPVPA